MKGLDARIVHTQHDEIIVEARADIADQVERIVKGVDGGGIGADYPRGPFCGRAQRIRSLGLIFEALSRPSISNCPK